ncbi:exopolysaccharide biosynthesis protein [Litoreibacter arenae]|uniref:exopolysaccharide biosynthesis protein n=1 Tax=Litoreibacter arenae TaxID=491388 RepID=UPI001470321A|nr:exopolysaccharide biosynthesis protein [Litoreibacter arenae]
MSESVIDIIDELEEMDDGRTVGDVVERLEHRGTAPFLIVPPLIELSPIGSVPGVPTVLAMFAALFAAQIVLGRSHLWIPDVIARRSVPDDKTEKTLKAMRPYAKWVDDKLSGKRFHLLVEEPARRVAATVVLGLCMVVPPMEVIPWASSLPMSAILCIGLALLFQNGVLMLFAGAFSVAALYGVFSLLT